MRNDEVKQEKATQMLVGAGVGSVLAVVVELLILLAGAAAISGGVVQESAQLQLVALACVAGGMTGGLVCACRWPARKLLGGLAVGGLNDVILWLVSLARGGAAGLEIHSLVVLTCCVCGGALGGVICLKGQKKRPSTVRRTRK